MQHPKSKFFNYNLLIIKGAFLGRRCGAQNRCTDTSACILISSVEILENSFTEGLMAFPNPTKGNVTIVLPEMQSELTVIVRNIQGVMISSKSVFDSDIVEMSIDYPAGVYIIEISNSHGDKAYLRIIKE